MELLLDTKQLESLAYKNEPIPQKIALVEKGYFAQLRDMYSDYNASEKTPELLEQCKRQKETLLKEYELEVEQKTDEIHRYLIFQENIRRAGELRAEINKSTDVVDMAKLAIECISLMIDDKGFLENMKKLESKK